MDKLIKCIKWSDGVVLAETESPDDIQDGERGYFITKEQLIDILHHGFKHGVLGKGFDALDYLRDLGVE